MPTFQFIDTDDDYVGEAEGKSARLAFRKVVEEHKLDGMHGPYRAFEQVPAGMFSVEKQTVVKIKEVV